MSRVLGRALGSLVVSPVIEFVDVNGVVQRINVDELIQRVDMDALLDSVDINHHLDRIDMNRLLDRIDLDVLLQKVDIQELVNRSDLPAIISQSSAGVFSSLMDAFRIQLALMDQVLHALVTCRCQCCCKHFYQELPPAPGKRKEKPRPYPKKTSLRALALQGRYAGIVSRTLAWFLDGIVIACLFALGIWVFETIWGLLVEDDYDVDRDAKLYALIFYAWSVCYHFCSLILTGRTIGRAVVGVLVVSNNGKQVRFLQALLFSLLSPIIVLTIIGLFFALLLPSRRMIHDILSYTAAVYSWDAKAARLREKDLSDMEQVQPVFGSAVVTENDIVGIKRSDTPPPV